MNMFSDHFHFHSGVKSDPLDNRDQVSSMRAVVDKDSLVEEIKKLGEKGDTFHASENKYWR